MFRWIVTPYIVYIVVLVLLELFVPSEEVLPSGYLVSCALGLGVLILLINLGLMFKFPYMVLSGGKVTLSFGHTIFKYSFHLRDVEKSYLRKYTGDNPVKRHIMADFDGIKVHLKDGSERAIRFVCMNEPDRFMIIAVFRKKGKLEE